MDKLISVIVPVYNVEKYLVECVESIIKQTYKNLEIILVNDGSTDSSLSICIKYKELDSRIIVVDKINGGSSSARNAGIKLATGDYLFFIDSDDYLNDLYGIEKIVNSIDYDYDVVNYKYKKYDELTKKVFECLPTPNYGELLSISDNKERIKWMILNSLFISSACNKLIKRKFLIENNLYFDEYRLAEDIVWSFKLLLNANSITAINLDFYVYRQRWNSVSHSISSLHLNHLIENLKEMIELVENIDNKNLTNIYYNFIAYQYGTALIAVQYTSIEVRKNYYSKLKSFVYLLKYDLDSKVYKLNLIYKCFGFNVLYLFSGIYAKVRK